MPGRTFLVVAILILGVTVPILVSRNDSGDSTTAVGAVEKAQTQLTAVWQRISGGGDEQQQATSPGNAEAESLLAENQKLLAGETIDVLELGTLPGVSLADALRFDVTPEWVRATWPRVTPQHMETGWYGTRVPLVTGTEEDDLAGSLTYYFNAQNYVERVTLYAYTGNAEPLISFLQQHYALRAVPSIGRGLFLSYFQNIPIGILKVQDAPVQSMDRQRALHWVRLELNLPRQGAVLSEDIMEKLRQLRDAKML